MVFSAKSENRISCPECPEDCISMEEVYKHSANFHYRRHFSDLYTSDYLLTDGACSICREKTADLSFFNYVVHIGGHHKLIHQFMTLDVLALYLKLAPSRQKSSLSVTTINAKEEKSTDIAVEDSLTTKHLIVNQVIENNEFSCLGTEKAISNHDLFPHFSISNFLPEVSDMEVGVEIERSPDATPTPQTRNPLEQQSLPKPVPSSSPTIFLSLEEICFDAEKGIEEAVKVKLEEKERLVHQQLKQDQNVGVKSIMPSNKQKELTRTKELVQDGFTKKDNITSSINYALPVELVNLDSDDENNEAIQYQSSNQNKKEPSCSSPQARANETTIRRVTKVSQSVKAQTKIIKPRSEMEDKQYVKLSRKIVDGNENKLKADKYKCPECSFASDHVSSIYTHSASKHYFCQLEDLHKNQFMMTPSKVCIQCPGRSVANIHKYIPHIGGKHKMIHLFISRVIVRLYEKFPAKTVNLGYNQSRLHSSLKCLVCKSGPFVNITAYKQHLTLHYKEPIIQEYKKNLPSLWPELTCFLCTKIEDLPDKPFSRHHGLISHLGSKHNLILDHAPDDVLQQLKHYNLTKC